MAMHDLHTYAVQQSAPGWWLVRAPDADPRAPAMWVVAAIDENFEKKFPLLPAARSRVSNRPEISAADAQI